MPEQTIVLEVFGEGKTDLHSESDKPVLPEQGVVPILVLKLCHSDKRLRVKTKRISHLQKGKLPRKVEFAKRQASNNAGTDGAVFVMDSEGDDLQAACRDLQKGRDRGLADFPMAVGVAHPCIEAWLLADANAIRVAQSLEKTPKLPEAPEGLPAPQKNRKHNPKTELNRICGVDSAKKKEEIACKMNDISLVRERCPKGFAPFANEVEEHILPLFTSEP